MALDPITGAAIITSVGSVLSGRSSAKAAKSAAKRQLKATKLATDLQREQNQAIRQDLTPYMNVGVQAANALIGGLYDRNLGGTGNLNGTEQVNLTEGLPDIQGFDPNSLADNPFLEFANREAMRDITNRAAAGGLLGSGGTLTALGDRLQYNNYNFAQNEFNRLAGLRKQLFNENAAQFEANSGLKQQDFNNLVGLATMGQNSAARTGMLAQSGQNQINDLITSGGDAQAAGIVGASNARNQMLQGLMNAGSMYFGSQAPQPQTQYSSPAMDSLFNNVYGFNNPATLQTSAPVASNGNFNSWSPNYAFSPTGT